ncbi:hypothetical protein SUGI_0992170 [Cryptomeria japonica]|nr:hypothetical protein SUGI_0992170 [Cryptomeria japonica]
MGSVPFVHVEDVCNTSIFLMKNPNAHGRYVCCSDNVSLADMAEIFRQRCPSIPVALDDKEQIEKAPIPSRKLIELGFSYKYGIEEIVDDSVECARHMQVL